MVFDLADALNCYVILYPGKCDKVLLKNPVVCSYKITVSWIKIPWLFNVFCLIHNLNCLGVWLVWFCGLLFLKVSQSVCISSKVLSLMRFFSLSVDTIRWVRPDCIVIGCFQLTDDGVEESYHVQVITSQDGKITNVGTRFMQFLLIKLCWKLPLCVLESTFTYSWIMLNFG